MEQIKTLEAEVVEFILSNGFKIIYRSYSNKSESVYIYIHRFTDDYRKIKIRISNHFVDECDDTLCVYLDTGLTEEKKMEILNRLEKAKKRYKKIKSEAERKSNDNEIVNILIRLYSINKIDAVVLALRLFKPTANMNHRGKYTNLSTFCELIKCDVKKVEKIINKKRG